MFQKCLRIIFAESLESELFRYECIFYDIHTLKQALMFIIWCAVQIYTLCLLFSKGILPQTQ
jgi:hypothetical protein